MLPRQTVPIIVVLQFPPMQSFKIHVSIESLYGKWIDCLAAVGCGLFDGDDFVANDLMIAPRVSNERLI